MSFWLRHGNISVSISLAAVGLSQLVFGLLPARVYSSEQFAEFSTYQSLLIGLSILISSPTYSLMLSSRFNANYDENDFQRIRSWLASNFLFLLLIIISVIIFFRNLSVITLVIAFGIAFLTNFESAVLRARLSFYEHWSQISILFFAEATLRLVVSFLHIIVGTPSPQVLVIENIALQLMVVLAAGQILGRENWKIISPFVWNLALRYYSILLIALFTLTLNTFVAPIAQIFHLDSAKEITLSIYLLMFARIPSTILFPLVQPEIQRKILDPKHQFSVLRMSVIPLILFLFYFFSLHLLTIRIPKLTEALAGTSFPLTLILTGLLSLLFLAESSIAFFLVNLHKYKYLVKMYSASLCLLLITIFYLDNAWKMILFVICSELVFISLFIIGQKFQRNWVS